MFRVAHHLLDVALVLNLEHLIDLSVVYSIILNPINLHQVVLNGRPKLRSVNFLATEASLSHLQSIY